MKSKKITALLLAGCMMVSFAACNNQGKRSNRDDDDRIEESETEKTEETTGETTEETTTEKETEETTTTESETEATQPKREAFSGKIIDFDDMSFSVKGKKYTLGKTTLQEMIDDGVPFNSTDLQKTSKTIEKNKQQLTGGFRIELDKFWSAQVYVMNLSDSDKTLAECVIYRVSLPSIDSNYNNGADLQFAFPLNITMDELVANAGEPAEGDKSHYDGDNGYFTDTYKYKQKSKKYIGSKTYTFEFKKGVIERIELNYIP